MYRWRAFALSFSAIAAIAVSGCVESTPREGTPTPAPSATTAVSPQPSPTATAAPALTPTPSATPAATPKPTATPNQVSGTPTDIQRFGLFLEIDGLSDESVVRGNSVIARGLTSADAILSINGVIVPVGADGSFEVLLQLNPGPNVMEVVASDLEGNEVSRVLAVVSLPEEAV